MFSVLFGCAFRELHIRELVCLLAWFFACLLYEDNNRQFDCQKQCLQSSLLFPSVCRARELTVETRFTKADSLLLRSAISLCFSKQRANKYFDSRAQIASNLRLVLLKVALRFCRLIKRAKDNQESAAALRTSNLPASKCRLKEL